MKKKLILTTIVLCFSLSFYAMQQFNEKLWLRINVIPSTNKLVFIISNTEVFSRTEIVNILIDGAKEFKVDLKTAYFSNGIFKAYLFLNDQESVFSKVPLIERTDFDFTTPDYDVYISTDASDSNSAGHLYSVFPLGVKVAEYHSFYDLVYEDAQLFGWYNASAVDIDDAKAFTQYLEKRLPNNVKVSNTAPYIEKNDFSVGKEILIIAFVLFLLFLLLEVSKNMKEISLRKSMGERMMSIIVDLFTPFFLTTLVSAMLTFIGSYWLLIRTFNPYTIEIIVQLGLYFILVIGLTTILLLVLGFIVFMISPVSIIKNKNINKSISNFNFALKIIFIVLLFPQLLGYARNAIDRSEFLVDYLANRDVITSNVALVGLNPNSSFAGNQAVLSRQSMIYRMYGIERSDFFIKYNEQDLPDEVLPNTNEYSNYVYIQVTKDYFRYYPLEVKEVDFESIKEPVLLVSQNRRKNVGFTYKSVCSECKIVVTSTEYRIPDFTVMFQASYKSPVLIVYPSIHDIVKITGIEYMPSGGFYYHAENPAEAIQKRDELINYFGNTWTFSNQENSIRRTLTDLSITTYYANIIFLQSLAALLLIIFHGITVLYELNKKEIAVHYLAGYSFIQRSSYIVMQDALLFVLMIGYLVLQSFPLADAVGYTLCVVLFNLFFASIHLLRNEKIQAIEAIKNG